MKLKFLLKINGFFLCLFLSVHIWANIQVVAYSGLPAVGFPEGFVYYGVDDPVIGSSGHIAFSGVADTNIRATANNTNAIWTGLPGQLELVVKENDVIAGFPANVFYDSIFTPPVVTSSGTVGILAQLKGAASGKGLLAYLDGTTNGIIKAGDEAPGFPAGTSIAEISGFSFSDRGMVFTGSAINGVNFNPGIWFWDFNKIELISSPVTDCYFSLPANPSNININELGEIVFSTLLLQNNSSQACSTVVGGIFKWSNGKTELLLAEGTPMPEKPDNQFLGISLQLNPLIINNQSEVIFSNGMSTLGGNVWVIDDSNEPKLLILHNEKLASSPNDIISALFIPFINYDFANDGFSIIPIFKTDGLSALLTGKPKALPPYDTGVSQLTKIASQNDQPPGFGPTWFFTESLGGLLNQVNNTEQYAFMANVQNGFDGRVMNAIWRGEGSSRPRLVAKPEMKLTISGQEYELEQIMGNKFGLSDNGHTVFRGVLVEGRSGNGIFLISDDNQQQQVFTLAEQLFPQYFLPANADNQFLDGFVYRYYPTTNTYIGIKNKEVFVLGELFGQGVQRIDTIENTIQFLQVRAAGS